MVNLDDVWDIIKDIPEFLESFSKQYWWLNKMRLQLDKISETINNLNFPEMPDLPATLNPLEWWSEVGNLIADSIVNKITSASGSERMGQFYNDALLDDLTQWSEINKINAVKKSWYSIDFEAVSEHYGIDYRQDIKIRKIFEKLFGQGGYPIRAFQYVGYISSIGMFLPDGWVIHAYKTKMKWLDDPSWRWRRVYIMYIGQENMKMYEAGIPFTVDTFIRMTIAGSSLEIWDIFPNLGFYNTINKDLIKANWDYVLEVLNSNGY